MQLSKKYYKRLLEEHKLKKNYLKNALMAFLFGGCVAIIGQIFLEVYQLFNLSLKEATPYMLLSIITIAIILSAFGIYDKLGQIGKCGLVIPITGDAR